MLILEHLCWFCYLMPLIKYAMLILLSDADFEDYIPDVNKADDFAF